jgi:hypothetical protein
MRHLTRLLVASGNYDDARRTFRIYVQLVSKSRETHAGSPNVSSEGPVVDSPADIDDDRTFVETLVLGARMLCKFGAKDDDVSEAHRVAQLAEEIVGGANFVKDDVLSAKVQRALGIVSAALAIKGQRGFENHLIRALTPPQSPMPTLGRNIKRQPSPI